MSNWSSISRKEHRGKEKLFHFRGSLFLIKTQTLDKVVHSCHPSIWEVQVGGSGFWDQQVWDCLSHRKGRESGAVAQWSVLAADSEALLLISSTHIVQLTSASNPSSRSSDVPFWLLGHLHTCDVGSFLYTTSLILFSSQLFEGLKICCCEPFTNMPKGEHPGGRAVAEPAWLT